MLARITAFSKRKECRLPLLHLALCAIFGAGFGVLFTATVNPSYLLMMRSAVKAPASIVGLMVVGIAPFLICLPMVSSGRPLLIYPICLCKVFLYAAGIYAIHLTFGRAGWLIVFLAQFSDFCLIPALFWFALRGLIGNKLRLRDILICFGISVLVILLDYLVISPFAVQLFDTYETVGRYAISCWI